MNGLSVRTDFGCPGRNMAIWVREGAFEDLVVNE